MFNKISDKMANAIIWIEENNRMKILEPKNTVTKIKTSGDNLATVMTQLKRLWNGRHVNRKNYRSKNVVKEGKLRK